MNDYQRQNCKGCVHKEHPGAESGYCYMFRDEPLGHCAQVKFPSPTNGRPPRVPNPPTKPVA